MGATEYDPVGPSGRRGLEEVSNECSGFGRCEVAPFHALHEARSRHVDHVDGDGPVFAGPPKCFFAQRPVLETVDRLGRRQDGHGTRDGFPNSGKNGGLDPDDGHCKPLPKALNGKRRRGVAGNDKRFYAPSDQKVDDGVDALQDERVGLLAPRGETAVRGKNQIFPGERPSHFKRHGEPSPARVQKSDGGRGIVAKSGHLRFRLKSAGSSERRMPPTMQRPPARPPAPSRSPTIQPSAAAKTLSMAKMTQARPGGTYRCP